MSVPNFSLKPLIAETLSRRFKGSQWALAIESTLSSSRPERSLQSRPPQSPTAHGSEQIREPGRLRTLICQTRSPVSSTSIDTKSWLEPHGQYHVFSDVALT